MSKSNRRLLAEIERWTEQRIITADQAAKIRELYPQVEGGRPWAMILFSSLGAVVLGLGVILVLAYNWDAIPKFGKLGLVFGSLIATHGAGMWLSWKRDPIPELGEALLLLGSMLFGAGIWLVAQVYHIDEHFPTGFLIWGAGALALAWSVRSVPQAMLACVALTCWSCSEVVQFSISHAASSVLLGLAIAALAWLKRSKLLMVTLLTATYFVVLAHIDFGGNSSRTFSGALALSTFLIALSRWMNVGTASAEGLAQAIRFFGLAGFVVCAYLLGFRGNVSGLLQGHTSADPEFFRLNSFRSIVSVMALIAWLGLLVRAAWKKASPVKPEEWFAPVTLVCSQVLPVTSSYGRTQAIAALFNLLLLAVATLWMARGCREANLRLVVRGSLLFAALIAARYFDLFESMATRGMVFVILGAVLFAEGIFYRRSRRKASAEGGAA